MSLPSKTLLVVAACLSTGVGYAGIKEVTMKNTEPTKVNSMARVPKDDASGTFSCYQEGRLIFQSKNLGNSTKATGAEASLVLADKGKSISLMDFKNGLCIFEQSTATPKAKKNGK